jgi:hypothetical protein
MITNFFPSLTFLYRWSIPSCNRKAQRTALSGLADRFWKAATSTILCGILKTRQRYLQPEGQVRFSAGLGRRFYVVGNNLIEFDEG